MALGKKANMNDSGEKEQLSEGMAERRKVNSYII